MQACKQKLRGGEGGGGGGGGGTWDGWGGLQNLLTIIRQGVVVHAHARLGGAAVGGLAAHWLCIHHLQHPPQACLQLWQNRQTRHGARHFHSMYFMVCA